MPPHARMSLAQQLLVRALVARFWRNPYQAKPIRWGTRLHDRFLLPYYVEQDFAQVAADLQSAGYPLDPAGLVRTSNFASRSTARWSTTASTIELRQAIEPWYVLGEEPGAGGTARFVDSSVERLAGARAGLVPERQAVTLQRTPPAVAVDRHLGEFVCGVRFRAWQPPRCLHPTIPVHAPLIFDLVDLANSRSLGGCTYHVAHPGGRNYETFPVNSNEAESRRRARFFAFGHTPGAMAVPPAETDPEFPGTLDLRRSARAGHA